MKGSQEMSNVIDLADQAMFLGERSPVANLLQCVWVYNRAIDIDGLQRFHHHLQRGRLSRRIERSPLPFGRHRWVTPSDPPGLEIVSTPRPREEFDAWLGEQANTPLDSEHGPGWHLAVLPFTDGGTGVSLLISHCLTDGVGLCEALADAACGRDDAFNWPAAASRRRWQALREDLRQTVRDVPGIGRAVVAAARLGLRSRRSGTGPVATTPAVPGRSDERITVPMAMIFVDADEWDARAHSLGGTSNTLLAGFAARLAQQVGRVDPDGLVTANMPVSERVSGDTRANAVTSVDITVDPALVTTDLREVRAATKQALIRHPEVPDERWPLLPLAPVVPKRLVRSMLGVGARGANVISSNMGAVNPAANRADGTDADYFAMKTLYPSVTRAMVHRAGGLLALLSGRAHGRVFVSILVYQQGRRNSDDALQQAISSALTDFLLTATTGWGCPEPVAERDEPLNPADVAGERNAQNRGKRCFRRLSLTSATQVQTPA